MNEYENVEVDGLHVKLRK
jgi:hypothetical protein